MAAVEPFEFTVVKVEGTFLEPAEAKGKARTEVLEAGEDGFMFLLGGERRNLGRSVIVFSEVGK